MLDSKTKEIDGITFSVEMLDSKQARAVFVRLSRLLGPALAELAQSGEANLLDVDHTVALGALSRLTGSLTEADLEYFCTVFTAKSKLYTAGVYVPVPDAIFAGKMTLLFKWLWFCFEVNYSDFLGVFKAMKPPTSTATAEASPSPSLPA